ncbi:hypothetical protein P9K20_005882 [Pseudomonas aeruginosa]
MAQPSPAGEYGDAYQGAREDIAIWKRRALEAEQALRQAHNGQTFMGEPLVQPYEAPREKVNALFKVLGFSGTASVGDILDAALERLQAQPSPAQAEQAEAERPEGPTEDELEAAGLGYPLHKEEAVKLWYSGFRSEVITVLEAWEAIGHDIGMNPDKGELLDSLRYMLEKCEAHDAALARVAELDQALAEKDPFGAKLNRISEKLERCNALLVARAAQAGQVPQAWLDVQAERRRQIEAKGWTPEHDDLYCSAELPRAAAAYIRNGANDEAPAIWPFSAKWWKPRDARANYVRAAALILAEIERLDRAAAAGKEVGHE